MKLESAAQKSNKKFKKATKMLITTAFCKVQMRPRLSLSFSERALNFISNQHFQNNYYLWSRLYTWFLLSIVMEVAIVRCTPFDSTLCRFLKSPKSGTFWICYNNDIVVRNKWKFRWASMGTESADYETLWEGKNILWSHLPNEL